jgi:S1-C subfamily serine protease
LITSIFLLAGFCRAESAAPELSGASPGEQQAIIAYCGDSRGAIARSLCMSNQVTELLRHGRKPDLAVATPTQRNDIASACSGEATPADRFACERAKLRAAGLPVNDEPGGGQINMVARGNQILSSRPPSLDRMPAMQAFDRDAWLSQRPAMQPAKGGGPLAAQDVYQLVSPAIYVILASDHAIELAERTPHTQGSAVAITDRILLTNCHVVAGRPQILISQRGQSGRATLIFADPAADRCFLKSNSLVLHPVPGIRRFSNLHVGETVFSVGAPSGMEESLGQGLISGLRRLAGVDLIQNSAPTWHGSSGGGLFDSRGNLIGITTAISKTVANMNFSIAAEDFFS